MMQNSQRILQVCLREIAWLDGSIHGPLVAGETVMSFPIEVRPQQGYTVLENAQPEAIIHQKWHRYEMVVTVMDVFQHPKADFTAVTLKAYQLYFVWPVFDKNLALPKAGQRLHMSTADLYLEAWYFYLVFISYTLPFDIPYLFQVYQLQQIQMIEPVFDKPVLEPAFERPSDYLLLEERQVISSGDKGLSDEMLLTLQLKAENAMDEIQHLIDDNDMGFFNWSAPFLSTYETQWALNWKERPQYPIFW